jgi:hypothetical protein
VLGRIDLALEPRSATLLTDQVARSILAPLDREPEGAEHTGGDEESLDPSAAAAALSRRH